MRVLDLLLGRSAGAKKSKVPARPWARPDLEVLEDRRLPNATAVLAGGTLVITGDPTFNDIQVTFNSGASTIVVTDYNQPVATFASAAVSAIRVDVSNAVFNVVKIDPAISVPAVINGAPAPGLPAPKVNFFQAGGGNTNLIGGPGVNRLTGGPGTNILDGRLGIVNTFGDANANGNNTYVGSLNPGLRIERFFGNQFNDTVVTPLGARDEDFRMNMPLPNLGQFLGLTPSDSLTISGQDVLTLLERASAATATANQAIVAVVDRGGRILGVNVGSGVSPAITGNLEKLVFAIDGAVAEARTGAFFANDQAPLTSRTVQNLSQTTVTQRDIESDPNVTDPNSPQRGPGTVAPLDINGNFPHNVQNNPQVDLFGIEYTNRDSIFAIGPDNVRGTADDVQLAQRFNINPAFISPNVPANEFLSPPDSYGVESGLLPTAQARGIGTLPGGLPIYETDPSTGKLVLVGGIGVFFPGTTGFADEENSALSSNFDPTRPDRSLEAEYIAFAALGGSSTAGFTVAPNGLADPGLGGTPNAFRFGALGGVAPIAGMDFPFGRIDLVGITLDIVGPHGLAGPETLKEFGATLGTGTVNGTLEPLLNFGPTNLQHFAGTAAAPTIAADETQLGAIDINAAAGISAGIAPTSHAALLNAQGVPVDGLPLKNGTLVPEGFIVQPHDAADGSMKAADVEKIIAQGVQQATQTRAAIRLPINSPTGMVLAVTSDTGEVLGLFREPDATIFSIDVAVSKARSTYYYDNANLLQPLDALPGVPAGAEFTARTFRYLALPFFPEGINTQPPGPFSQLINDAGTNQKTGLEIPGTTPTPASAFQAPFGFNAYFPSTNFHDPRNTGVFAGLGMFQNPLLNRSGVVYFPGSAAIYVNGAEVAGFGVSGDGVDQDDVVTFVGSIGFTAPPTVPTADQTFFLGVRLPFQKFNRQPNLDADKAAVNNL